MGPQVGEVTRLAVNEKKRVYIQSSKGFLRLLLLLQLGSLSGRKINSQTRMYLFVKASRVVLRGVRLREEPLTQYLIRNRLEEKWSIYDAK